MKLKPASAFRIFTGVLAACVLANTSAAAATASLSAGDDCGGGSAGAFTTSGGNVKVSLCAATSGKERVCGYTVNLQSASAPASGAFKVADIVYSASFPDKNTEFTLPVSIIASPGAIDFGATTTGEPPATGGSVRLMTFVIAPQSAAAADSYEIVLSATSIFAISEDSACSKLREVPIAARFVLKRR